MKRNNIILNRRKPIGIFWKIFGLIISVVILSLAIVLVVNVKEIEGRFTQYNMQRLITQTRHATRMISDDWDKPTNIDDADDIAQLLGTKLMLIDKNKDLIFVSDNLIRTRKNYEGSEGEAAIDETYENAKQILEEQLESTFDKPLGNNATKTVVKKTKIQNRDYFISARHKYDDEGNFVGTVFLAMRYRAIRIFNQTTPKTFIYGALISLLIALIVAAILSFSITRPVLRINDLANKMAEGDFDVRIDKIGNDEIGMLTHSINELSGKIQHLETMRDQYVANVSHELRTPLTGLRGLLEPVIDGLITDEQEKQKYLTRAYDETLRLINLIEELLKLSRYGGADVNVEMEHVDVNTLLVSVAEKLKMYYADYEKNIDITTMPDLNIKHIYSNAWYIEEILTIFVNNAVKFADEKKPQNKAVLYSKMEGDSIIIGVKDNGIGMTEENKKYIFERFYQANERSSVNEGLGLGLFIAKEVAKILNVDIKVESEQSIGSDFYIVIDGQGNVEA